jgi:hypothetical protein
MNYDQYKTAEPPDEIPCEVCGDYVKEYHVFTPDGHKWGYLLCAGCHDEMTRIAKEERAAAFELMNES